MKQAVGVLVFAKNIGLVQDIILRNLLVRDVNGVISKSEGGKQDSMEVEVEEGTKWDAYRELSRITL